ncbi:Yip1 family protein [Neptunicella sp. SCSIO 80796]|uniref:Yip1 family protein n=1 Tax=Neptunicella plasticusilytica TaxID=3117012 RepID=UPI003A4DDED7
MEQKYTPFQACSDIFFKPNRVFAALTHQHNWSWIPFFLVILMATMPIYLYFNFVDFEWYKEIIVQAQAGSKSPAEQAAFADRLNKSNMQIFSIIGIGFGLIVVNAIIALYLNIMAKMDENNVNGFTDWYGFLWWTSMPIVLTGLISLTVIVLSDNHQLPMESLSPLTLSYLLGLEATSDWYNLASNIRVESFWAMYLIAVGISQWTQLSNKQCWAIAVAPSLIIWGIWTIIKLV